MFSNNNNYNYHSNSSRRSFLGDVFILGTIASALGALTFGAVGCRAGPKELALAEIYFNSSNKKITELRQRYLANTESEGKQKPSVAASPSPLESPLLKQLQRTQNALMLVEKLMSESLNFQCGRYHFSSQQFLYGEGLTYLGGDFHFKIEELTALPGYKSYAEVVVGTRKEIITSLLETKKEIDRMAGEPSERDCNQIEALLYVNISKKLGILADRIEQRVFLLSQNVVHQSWKGGSSDTILGRTEYFEEAQQEISQLIGIISAQTRRQAGEK